MQTRSCLRPACDRETKPDARAKNHQRCHRPKNSLQPLHDGKVAQPRKLQSRNNEFLTRISDGLTGRGLKFSGGFAAKTHLTAGW
jgi:hypothetical protein